VAFIGDDCSVYVPLRPDAWGVAFRIHDWSRAYTEFDLPMPSKIGRKLFQLHPSATAPPTAELLYDAGAGALGSPSASFDGASILVSLASEGSSFFHIYRIPLVGGPPQRLTDGPFHDLDPVELPDGRIAFASTRIGTFEEYHQPPSRALFRMNADGSGIHPITSTLIFDNEPKVMADGRLIFIRTDNFFDRGKVETQLHVIRPDGTAGQTEFGAQVGPLYGNRLRAFGYGSPAPLPDGRVAFIAHQGNFIGHPGAPEREFHRLPNALGDLAPLPDGRLLATVLPTYGAHRKTDTLAVLDPRDNRMVRLHQNPAAGLHSPISLAPRPRPPIIPDYSHPRLTEKPDPTGYLFCQDARFTTKTKADWNSIRSIRVLGAFPLTLRSSHSHIVHVGHETVELGTVPLASDGSFFVEVPADMPLALQAVDAEGRSELNQMSWIYVRPGERRACLGCHQPREAAPTPDGRLAEALRTPALRTVGQGNPHRFRGNNAGVTGLMDLQFERFRETASLNRFLHPHAPAREDIATEIRLLSQPDTPPDQRVSAAQRLAIFRTATAATALASNLRHPQREVRVAAALALAPCGTRASIPPLLYALDDPDPLVAQAACVTLENLTGHAFPIPDWKPWFLAHSWDQIESSLITQLATHPNPRSALIALGHIGGDPARVALRQWIAHHTISHPYPPFENDNRTDSFTFDARSPFNPRTLQEAVRALGRLRDPDALPLLERLLAHNHQPRTGNLFLAEAVIQALIYLGSPTAEDLLLRTFAQLDDYWHYVGWYSDHPALYACHASPIHARLIEALDTLGSTRTGPLLPLLIRSVPTDPDRALFFANDDYEHLVGRLIRRSGREAEVVETCLALLGDPLARPHPDLEASIRLTHPAWAGHPGPENRAAHILSLATRDSSLTPRVQAAFQRFLNQPEEPVHRTLGNPDWTPVRHWVLFYLARTLGQLGDPNAVDTLLPVLAHSLNEARHGRPNPAEPIIHFLHLDYTPTWRAAAAWALGQLADPRAVPTLLNTVRQLDNAPDVRHAAAVALGRIADPDSLESLQQLAADYPEVSTRRALLRACAHANP
jgi:HEAT repeat protein